MELFARFLGFAKFRALPDQTMQKELDQDHKLRLNLTPSQPRGCGAAIVRALCARSSCILTLYLRMRRSSEAAQVHRPSR